MKTSMMLKSFTKLDMKAVSSSLFCALYVPVRKIPVQYYWHLNVHFIVEPLYSGHAL